MAKKRAKKRAKNADRFPLACAKGEEIFKLQIPLASSEENAPALAYNRDRSVEVFLDARQVPVAFGPKSYWWARVARGGLILLRPAKPQDW